MNPNKEGWIYLAVPKLAALFRGISLKHDGDFFCLSFVQKKSKLESIKMYE